jgi:hypothetical protein
MLPPFAPSAVSIVSDNDGNQRPEFTLPLPEEGDFNAECEWYFQLYWHHYWTEKMGMPKDLVIIDTDLLRADLTRFAPHIHYDHFFQPGPYYALGPFCDVIEISFDGEKGETFERIRQLATEVMPPGIAELARERQVRQIAMQ